MPQPAKARYQIDLTAALPRSSPAGIDIRQLRPSDRDALAHLMLDAYVGTIDYEGETLTEATDEIDSWLEDGPLLDHSYGAVLNGQLLSAVLVVEADHIPLIGYVMTAADHKGNGLGGAVTSEAVVSLKNSGYPHAVLYITKGNTPSERLFEGLGAALVDIDTRPSPS